MKKFKLVEVLWDDSASVDGWFPEEFVKNAKMPECKTTGYLYEETTRYIMLFCTVSNTGNYASLWKIPRGSVRSIRELK